MKTLRTHVVSLALASAFAVSAPTYASPLVPSANLGTPVHNGVPEHRSRNTERVIVIDSGTKHINVEGGQAVQFVVGDKSFEWLFDTYGASPAFDLSDIAPTGILGDQHVKVYVSRDPLYFN